MLKFKVIILSLILPYLSHATVKSVEWIDKSKGLKQAEGDIVDIIIPVKDNNINRDYQEAGKLNKEPFPTTPSKEQPLNLLSLTQKALQRPTLSSSISEKEIDKTYTLRYITNELKDTVPEECHAYYLDAKLEQTSSLKEFRQELERFFKRCDKKTVNSMKNKYGDLIKLSLRKYKVLNNKNVHPFRIKFINNESLEGYLALKPNKKRPLVIVKCGVFCNGKSSTMNNMITASLYDSGPFHLLVIANHTGSRNIQQNKRVNIGGFIEGQEIIKVAEWAKNESSFKKYVSEVHVLGVSLGGHGALYSSLYNDHLDQKVISSVMGLCPVTNVKNSVYDVTAKGLLGTVVSHIVQDLVKDNYNAIPYLQDHIDITKKIDKKNMSTNLANINVDYINTLNSHQFLPPFQSISIKNKDDYFYYNDFNQHLENLKTPTFIWASRNDPVVQYSGNSQIILNDHQNLERNLQVLSMRKGSHCALHESHGWYTVSKILNNYFIKHSPSLLNKTQRNIASINFEQPRLRSSERYAGVRFLTFAKKDKVVIQYKIYRGEPYRHPFYAQSFDFRRSTIEVDMSDLPFRLKPPQTEVEAQVLTRWLNTNVHLKINQELFHINRKQAQSIEWTNLN